ncbi:MAG: alpha-L-fucosidase [Ignavibacteriales bacterium]|nr:alpha-L-fucosidase [Ignavibacteriales bacterium]
MRLLFSLFFAVICVARSQQPQQRDYLQETKAQREARMQWWSEARFGMFIHWGLYSIPAGEWKGSTNHAEWIRTTAQIPLTEYDKFVGQFNPVKFNAVEWVRMAKNAGMKYITITSKHHDGFCLFDSKYTEFDVMSTPFKRDIMKELADACHKEGIKICWYHSIMDWHHPDYLPRREWEKDRSAAGAEFDRYFQHLKNQLKELLTNYGEIGVLWFDGEWESTWNTKYGTELYNYVRSLQPNIIINNRVGAGRSGMEGFTKAGEFAGDFGTPEQEIPATGLSGVSWETCMTMNDNWGFNKHDDRWKSTDDLVQKLADIASKGGNFLLNIGPTSEGVFPQPAIDRLGQLGDWMKVNGEAIYETKASPFKNLEWGRCTQKTIDGGVRLYLHVFKWPASGKLVVPGILNEPKIAYLLADRERQHLLVRRQEDAIVINVPGKAPDPINSVIVLDVRGNIDVTSPPKIGAKFEVFIDGLDVSVGSEREKVEIRYSLDGSLPTANSKLVAGPIRVTETTTVTARCFCDGSPVSGPGSATFTKVSPNPAVNIAGLAAGIQYSCYQGDWNVLPDFGKLKPVKEGVTSVFDISLGAQPEYFGLDFNGFIRVPENGVYAFSTESDDGSRLFVDGKMIADNDGLHGNREVKGVVALAVGLHGIRVQYFQKGGGRDLKVFVEGPKGEKLVIPASMLFYQQK